jgi:hypothetical protein
MTDKPRTEMTMSEAFDSLNYFELQDMKKTFGVTMSQLEAMVDNAMWGLVYVIEKRTNPKVDVKEVKGLTFKDISTYFTPEELIEGEQGKDDSPDE